MGRLSDEDIARVRDATDLVALISETVPLKKRGRLMWGNCPFHNEKTPSFKIDPATQLWHCFGCGKGGDAFGFMMESERLEFPDAVRRLAERAHIEITEEGGRGLPLARRERLFAALDAAAAYYHRQLVSARTGGASAARDYLAGRGFGLDVAKRWNLGYAPPGRTTLVRELTAAGFSREDITDANLGMADGASVRDRFYDRIMFPIADVSGRVIGFGGRILGKGEPKYLNTQETPVFHKSANLYGLDRARGTIVADGAAVVVEGYTDVIAMHEAGIRSAVATLGTALTERQVRLLGRFGKTIVYLFDGDEAGRRAALRAVEFLDWTVTPEAGSERVALKVALIPDGQDPADLVRTGGAEAARRVVESAEPLLKFALDARLGQHDLGTPEGRWAALGDAAAVLSPVRDSLLGQDYMNYLASRLQTDYTTVQRAVPVTRKKGENRYTDGAAEWEVSGDASPAVTSGDTSYVPDSLTPPDVRAERTLVKLAAIRPALRSEAAVLLDEGVIADPLAKKLLALIVASEDAGGETLYAAVSARDRHLAEILSGWLVDASEVEQVQYEFRDVGIRVREFALARTIRAKQAELAVLDPDRSSDRYDVLFAEIAELTRKQKTLRKH